MCQYIGIKYPIGGGGGGTPGTTERLRDYHFTLKGRVPGSGTQYLFVHDASTSDVPHVVLGAGAFFGATIAVNTADASNDYDVQFLLNGSVVETLSFSSGNTKAIDTSFSTSVSSLDEIEVRMVRTSGSGRSDFRRAVVTLHILES